MSETPVDAIRSFEDFYAAKIASLVTDYGKNSKSFNKTGVYFYHSFISCPYQPV